MENRRLFALVGIGSGTFPDVTYGPINALDPTPPISYPLTYSANGAITVADNFDTDATPLFVRFPNAPGVQRPVANALAGAVVRDFKIDIYVDNNGNLIGGGLGDDLSVKGQVTDTSPGGPTTYGNVTGTLLRGEIVAFGWADTTPTTSVGTADNYDFVFRPTGGEMVGLFGDNYIGVLLQSSDSTFAGDFNQDFRGRASGDLFPVDWADPSIDVVKKTNGTDNNSPTGPLVPVGSTVTWTYDVTNTSNVTLENVVVTDDNGTPGNTGDDFVVGTVPSLAPGASASFTATGTATAGQYANTATATGNYVLNYSVSDTDVDHYFGAVSSISLVKKTNGTDNNSPTGPVVEVGSTVTWTYIVTNTGNVPLATVALKDDNGTPANTADDFIPTRIGGDANSNNLLDLNETWTYTATGVAALGQYQNTGTASGKDPINRTVSDTDLDHYKGVVTSISGKKVTDITGNGLSADDTPLGGTTIQLYRDVNNDGSLTGADGGPVLTTATASGTGAYSFTGLAPGRYFVQEVVPTGYARTAPSSGTYTVVLALGTQATGKDFANAKLASLGDYVWADLNANGVQDSDEGSEGIAGITVKLLNSAGTTVLATTTTDSNGKYLFSNLMPGSYMVQFFQGTDWSLTLQNAGANDGIDSDGNTTTGKTGVYTLVSGQNNLTVDQGLIGKLHGRTGTIGFWANKNGQDLINLLGSSSTSLGNWLAATYPKMYGSTAGLNNFTNKTRSYVAQRFVTIFDLQGPKVDAQVLATALAVYTTTKTLNSTSAGQAKAMKHGFKLFTATATDNLQNSLWNVGSNGAAFGVANHSNVKVSDLLLKANASAVNGVLWASSKTVGTITYSSQDLRNLANVVFSGINRAGDILPWM